MGKPVIVHRLPNVDCTSDSSSDPALKAQPAGWHYCLETDAATLQAWVEGWLLANQDGQVGVCWWAVTSRWLGGLAGGQACCAAEPCIALVLHGLIAGHWLLQLLRWSHCCCAALPLQIEHLTHVTAGDGLEQVCQGVRDVRQAANSALDTMSHLTLPAEDAATMLRDLQLAAPPKVGLCGQVASDAILASLPAACCLR